MIDKFSMFTKNNNKKNNEIKNPKNNSYVEKSNKNLDQDILNSLLKIGN